MSPRIRRVLTAAALGVAAVSMTGTAAVAEQAPTPLLPSVSVRPLHVDPAAANHGGWFVFRLSPGQVGSNAALVTNVSSAAEFVTAYARDLSFSANGSPQIDDGVQHDVGAWITLGRRTVTVPPRTSVVIPFQVQVPHDVVPGDHIGVFVVQSVPQRDGVNQLIERVATRLYVTVPGVASRGMVISGLSRQLHSAIWPSSVSLLTILRNTGRIALNPIVAVNGRRAAGSTTLLAESRELYSTKLHLPWWGGHVRLRILAWAPGVPLQTRELTFWVINWVLIAVVLLGLLTVALVVTMWRRRRRRARAERRTLESRLRELESLVQTGG